MGSGNWVVDILNNAIETWSNMFAQIWTLISTSPQNFKDGAVWDVMLSIHDGLKAIALGLLVLFFVIGVVKTTTNFSELKRPEHALKLFLRFAVAKIVVTYGLDLILAIFRIIQGVIVQIANGSGGLVGGDLALPEIVRQKIFESGFFESIPLWIVALIGALLITVPSFLMLLTVYSRFFQLYMYTALAPIPLSTFAGEGTSAVGKQFLKSYAGVCLQGAIVVLACIIYSAFITAPPENFDSSLSAIQISWNYLTELIFNMLVLVGAVKMSEKVVKEMIGF